MTDTDLPAAAEPLALQPVEPGYRTVLRLQWAVMMIPLAIGAYVLDYLLIRVEGGPWPLLTIVMSLFAVSAITMTAARQHARWGYAMGPDSLRVARGYLFHTDTVVPFVRVQHIDVGQGPFERMCGVSHLVVHTAGTHNSIVTLPGLAPDDAAVMRDTIRRHIQTDFA